MDNYAQLEGLLLEDLSGEEQSTISGGDGPAQPQNPWGNPYPPYGGGNTGGGFNPYSFQGITQQQYNSWAAGKILDTMYEDGPPYNPYEGFGGGGD